nr:FtsW/RodA/SpoVE family cell cycle protein [Nigerium massiliense]
MAEVIVYRKRGFVSLLMLMLAIALCFGGYALTHLNQYGALTGDWFVVPAAFGGIALVVWLVIVWRLPYADPLLLPCVVALNGIGLAMIHRLDLATDPPMKSAELQLMWVAISAALMCLLVVFLRDHRRLQRYTYVWFVAGLVLLLMPLLPVVGSENHGARIWIRIGQFSFQPAEIAKIILSIAFAAYLTEKRDVLALAGHRFLGIDFPRARDLGPILIMWGASLLVLVFQKDLGTTLLFFGLFVMMIYVATERPSWALLGFLMLIGMGVLGYTLFDHVKVRFGSWLDPFANYDQNLQVINAQFGFAWGGLFGTGWGLGRPYLTPLAKNDFISAAIGEELGLFGLFAVIMIFALIVARVMRAALAAREPFGKLLAAGLAFVFALQVFVIIGGVTRLLPLTGLTTPFVSQGGSSLVANYLLLGLMVTITHQGRRPHVDVSPDEYVSLAGDATQSMSAVAPRGAVSSATRSRPQDDVNEALGPRPDPADFEAPTELVGRDGQGAPRPAAGMAGPGAAGVGAAGASVARPPEAGAEAPTEVVGVAGPNRDPGADAPTEVVGGAGAARPRPSAWADYDGDDGEATQALDPVDIPRKDEEDPR